MFLTESKPSRKDRGFLVQNTIPSTLSFDRLIRENPPVIRINPFTVALPKPVKKPFSVKGRYISPIAGRNDQKDPSPFLQRTYSTVLAAMGIRLPIPKALEVTLSPGAACLRLYSDLEIALITHNTVSFSKPFSTICDRGTVLLYIKVDYFIQYRIGRKGVTILLIRS